MAKLPVKYFTVPTEIFYRSLKPNDLIVFIGLCRFYPKMFPSLRTLANITGLAKSTVQKSIKRLTEDYEYISYVKGGTGHSSIYTINFAKLKGPSRQEVIRETSAAEVLAEELTPAQLDSIRWSKMTPKEVEADMDSNIMGGAK